MLSVDPDLQGACFSLNVVCVFFSQGECRHLFDSTRGHIILSVDSGLQGGLNLIECRLCIYKAKWLFEISYKVSTRQKS